MARALLLSSAMIASLLGGHAATRADAGELPTVVVTRQLAERYGYSTGGIVELSARPDGGEPRRFRIAGVYEPTPDPMLLADPRLELRLHLPDLIDLAAAPGDPADRERVDAINLRLAAGTDPVRVADAISVRMPTLVVDSTAPAFDQESPFLVLERFHQAIALVTVLGSTAFLLALMVMRADERRETIGILRLIGFSRPRTLVEVLVEGLCIALFGALFGVLFAAAMESAINAFFQHRYDTTLVFVRVTPSVAWRCVLISVPLGVLAGLVASWHLLRREVVALIHR